MNRSFMTSRRAVPLRVGQRSASDTPAIESRYAPFSIGITNPAAGLFEIDSNVRRVGWRVQAPNLGTASILWIYASITGAAVNETLRVRVCLGATGDLYQPNLSGGTLEWTVPSTAAADWIGIDISSLAFSFAVNDVIHVVLERQAGTFSGARKISFPSVKSRFPLQHTYRSNAFGTSIRDDYNAMMYAADNTDLAANPYCVQATDNGKFHPIWFLQCSVGQGFGNPFDAIEEVMVYGEEGGANAFEMNVLASMRLDINEFAINMRGSGAGADPFLPQDHLYVTIKNSQGTVLYGPTVFVNLNDRLFKGRPHWFGHRVAPGFTLRRGNRYSFVFSSPGSANSYSTDSYLVTLAKSTLSASVFTNAGGVDSYAVLSGVQYDPPGTSTRAIFGFMLRRFDRSTGPIIVIDEFGSQVAGVGTTSPKAHAGQTVVYSGLSRNIGTLSDGIVGGEIFVRLVDVATGLPPPGYTGDVIVTGPLGIVPLTDHNNEHTGHNWSLGFTMPSSDIHLRLETGHALIPGSLVVGGGVFFSGVPVVDDWSPVEMRVY